MHSGSEQDHITRGTALSGAWLPGIARLLGDPLDNLTTGVDVDPPIVSELGPRSAPPDRRRPMPAKLLELPRSAEPYITLEEVAERLGYSTRWVRDRIRLDGLPSHQRGRGAKHRFRWSEVELWDAARSGGAQ